MSRNFELEFNDLSYEKQQEMIESIKEDWIEALKQEGRQEILSQRTNREGVTNEVFWRNWQKEYNATDDQLVLIAINELYDFEAIEDDTEYNEQFYKSLGYSLEDMAEKGAEEACWAGVHNMEIEVETP